MPASLNFGQRFCYQIHSSEMQTSIVRATQIITGHHGQQVNAAELTRDNSQLQITIGEEDGREVMKFMFVAGEDEVDIWTRAKGFLRLGGQDIVLQVLTEEKDDYLDTPDEVLTEAEEQGNIIDLRA